MIPFCFMCHQNIRFPWANTNSNHLASYILLIFVIAVLACWKINGDSSSKWLKFFEKGKPLCFKIQTSSAANTFARTKEYYKEWRKTREVASWLRVSDHQLLCPFWFLVFFFCLFGSLRWITARKIIKKSTKAEEIMRRNRGGASTLLRRFSPHRSSLRLMSSGDANWSCS